TSGGSSPWMPCPDAVRSGSLAGDRSPRRASRSPFGSLARATQLFQGFPALLARAARAFETVSRSLGGVSAVLAQRVQDRLRQRRREPRYAGELLHARGLDALHAAEAPQQRLLLHRPDARDRIEARAQLAALLAVVGDREAVRLVADALEQ